MKEISKKKLVANETGESFRFMMEEKGASKRPYLQLKKLVELAKSPPLRGEPYLFIRTYRKILLSSPQVRQYNE